jgi:thymidylate synthase (FAD)
LKIAEISVDYLGGFGSDATVVNAARVSFHKECAEFEEKDTKLIKYLAKHKHFSPFNHAFLSFRVKAPIFVARQLVKHKFLPWNEVSRRYVDEEPEFYMPDGWRERGENIKQGSGEGFVTEYVFREFDGSGHPHQHGVDEGAEQVAEQAVEWALESYNAMLYAGVAPEQARMLLPQNMMTEWIWSGTLGAFLDMLVLRLDPHTQKESRDVANLIAMHVERVFPVSFDARINQ